MTEDLGFNPSHDKTFVPATKDTGSSWVSGGVTVTPAVIVNGRVGNVLQGRRERDLRRKIAKLKRKAAAANRRVGELEPKAARYDDAAEAREWLSRQRQAEKRSLETYVRTLGLGKAAVEGIRRAVDIDPHSRIALNDMHKTLYVSRFALTRGHIYDKHYADRPAAWLASRGSMKPLRREDIPLGWAFDRWTRNMGIVFIDRIQDDRFAADFPLEQK